MRLTHCRLFRVAHTVGLQRIKKPFSLSAVEFGFSCSTPTRATRTYAAHARTHDPFMYIRGRVSSSNTMFACTLYRSTTFCSLLRNVERQNFDLLRTHVYSREKKRTNCATGPIVRFRWLVFLSLAPQRPPRGIPPRIFFFFFPSLFVSSPNCAALCFVSLRTGSKFINHR